MKHFLRRSLLLPILLLLSCFLFAQQKTVTGKIVDSDGKAIQGVNIGIKGSTTTTITNANGVFSIVVPANESVLKMSSATFVYQEVVVGDRTSLSITMQSDTKQLDDVVVIGYGTQRTRAVTGSIVSVSTKKLEDLPVASLSEMLRGQVPGLNVSGGSQRPGAMATISIRQQFNWGKDGGGTIPLIVIDDVVQIDPATNLPTLERFNLLDLSEVESITVLRDASAAIYGARGSQGAIVVKTKRGKLGPPQVSYSGKFETMDAVSHGKVMNAKEYAVFANRFGRAAGWNAQSFFTPTELSMLDSVNYDWMHDWRSAGAMQHSINVSGGSERATFFTGGSYYKQGANLGSQDFSRWTFRSGVDVKVGQGLKFSATLGAQNSSLEKSFTKVNITDGYASGGEQNDYSILLHMPKYIPWEYTINGTTQFISPPLAPNRTGSATGNNSLSNWNYYSLLNNGSLTTSKNFGYNVNFGLQYDIPFVKGLSVKASYAVQSTAGSTEQVMMPMIISQVASGNAAANPLTNHIYTPTTVWNSPATNRSNSRVTYDNTTGSSEQINFFVNYDRTFGSHNVGVVLSGERAKNTFEDRYQIYDNPIPGVYNGTSVTAGTLNASNSITSRSESGTLSYLGRASYSYKNKYFAQFVFRTDASSKFAPENYWGFFPSVSAGWVISDESFFKVRWINMLKIRASLGRTGNDNVKAWKWMQLYSAASDKGMAFGTAGGNYTYGLTPEVTPNRAIRWDKTIQRNIGVDLSVLRRRLSISWDAYYNSSTDLLTDMSTATNVPISVGGAFAELNYGAVNFWGTEMSATWSDRVGKVDYSIGMNFGVSGNEVKKALDIPFNYPSTYAGKKQEGYSLFGAQWGYKTWKQTSGGDGILRTDADIDAYWTYLTDLATRAGTTPLYNAGSANISSKASLRKGMLAYEDIAGNLNANTQTIAGQNGQINDEQDYIKLKNKNKSFGITTNLSVSYKSFSLLAQIATSWGGWNSQDRVKQGTSSTNAMWSQVAYLNDMYDSTDNPNGKYPNMFYYDQAYKNSDFWTMPSFRAVVRSMSIGYTVPKAWSSKLHMSSAKIVLSGYNLWDLYNPYPNKYRNMYDGINVNYPTLRTWALGVNLGF
ncbi:MAG: SusC/RagA family TonB-linked outer membrane protein [Chitinophagaceae bacterium]|nr:SusC/RagA family TonB-linked outer membrane protein [Chitinophagaceae bacterium]